MKRRIFLGSLLALTAGPSLLWAQQDIPSGTPVLSSDGFLVGKTRSRPRLRGGDLVLYVNPKGSRTFRSIDEDVIITVPPSDIRIDAQGVILPASRLALRQGLYYNARENTYGRVFLN